MSFIDKIKDLVNVPDDDYEEDDYIEESFEQEEVKKPRHEKPAFRAAPEREKKASTSDYSRFSES